MGFSLVVWKKVPATWYDFCSWFQRKCLLPCGILFFFPKYPRFWNLKLDFCPLKKVFEIFCRNIVNHRPINYSWPKFQQICGIFFFTKYPRFWNLKLDFCPIKKVFCRFSKIRQIFFTWTLFLKIKKKKSEKLFREVGSSQVIWIGNSFWKGYIFGTSYSLPLASLAVVRGGGS